LIDLVSKAKQGDVNAFHQLYNQFGRDIYNFVYRLTGSKEEAEDLTQETFVKAYMELKHLREDSRFKSWLFSIARNEVYQRARRHAFKTKSLEEEPVQIRSQEKNPEEAYLHGELSELVQSALDSLPLKLKTVLILAAVQNHSYQEIAEMVGRSMAAVKTDIHRARLRVRDYIKKHTGP